MKIVSSLLFSFHYIYIYMVCIYKKSNFILQCNILHWLSMRWNRHLFFYTIHFYSAWVVYRRMKGFLKLPIHGITAQFIPVVCLLTSCSSTTSCYLRFSRRLTPTCTCSDNEQNGFEIKTHARTELAIILATLVDRQGERNRFKRFSDHRQIMDYSTPYKLTDLL